MALSVMTEFQDIMCGGGHRPVIVTQDALIVVGQLLSADLGKEAFLVHMGPSLGQAETA